MNEVIPLSVAIKSASEANELAEKFVLKNRVLKDTPSVGGFKISKENLKKREEYLQDGYEKTIFNQNENERFESTNYKTKSEQRFYSSNNMMNSTSIIFSKFL
jgi:antitoxin component YwqK of YwqJK toxin-antitoxin module